MKSLNYKHLHYFWMVAKEGSIARASELLHLTPQTISGQLTQFEEAVGTQLFARSGRQLVLTEAGRQALSYADEIFQLGSELAELLRNRPAAGRPLRFTVGIADVVPKLIAYRLLEPALHLPETVRLVCQEGSFEELLADMAVHKLDVVLADSPISPAMNVRLYNHPLGECGTTFFAARDQIAAYRTRFPASMDGAPLLLPTAESAIRNGLDRWFDDVGIHPIIAGEFQDSALLKTFGQAGVGIFAAPSAIEAEIQQQYDVGPIGQTSAVRQQFFAISAERRIRHPAVTAISDAARQRLFI